MRGFFSAGNCGSAILVGLRNKCAKNSFWQSRMRRRNRFFASIVKQVNHERHGYIYVHCAVNYYSSMARSGVATGSRIRVPSSRPLQTRRPRPQVRSKPAINDNGSTSAQRVHTENTRNKHQNHKQQPSLRPLMTIGGQFYPIQGGPLSIHDLPQDPQGVSPADPPCSGGFR